MRFCGLPEATCSSARFEVPEESCLLEMSGEFGGPHCAEPYGDEVLSTVKRVGADSDKHKSLDFINFTGPCLELAINTNADGEGFDYADEKKKKQKKKKKKLPLGPLPWPTGLCALGYAPETKPLNGLWVTASGGDNTGVIKNRSRMARGADSEASYIFQLVWTPRRHVTSFKRRADLETAHSRRSPLAPGRWATVAGGDADFLENIDRESHVGRRRCFQMVLICPHVSNVEPVVCPRKLREFEFVHAGSFQFKRVFF